MHNSDMEIRSPALSNMSISRVGCTELTSAANRTRSSVALPMALTTTTTLSPSRRVRATWSATERIRSASATEVPPNFCTNSGMISQGYRGGLTGLPGLTPGAAPRGSNAGRGGWRGAREGDDTERGDDGTPGGTGYPDAP
jgi:hypothetical protein